MSYDWTLVLPWIINEHFDVWPILQSIYSPWQTDPMSPPPPPLPPPPPSHPTPIPPPTHPSPSQPPQKWFDEFNLTVTNYYVTYRSFGGAPYWGCAAPKGHFLSPVSVAKGGFFLANIPLPRVYFLRNPLKMGIWGLNYGLFRKISLNKEILGLKFLQKSHKNGLMVRKFSLAKGMFSTKFP